MDEDKEKLERAKRQLLEKLSAHSAELKTKLGAAAPPVAAASSATKQDTGEGLITGKEKAGQKEDVYLNEGNEGEVPAFVNDILSCNNDRMGERADGLKHVNEGKKAARRKDGAAGKGLIPKGHMGTNEIHGHGAKGAGNGQGNSRGKKERRAVEDSQESGKFVDDHQGKRTRPSLGHSERKYGEKVGQKKQSAAGRDHFSRKAHKEWLRKDQGHGSQSLMQLSHAGHEPHENQPSLLPELRRKNDEAKKEVGSIEKLSRLNRDLDLTMERFRAGGVSARVGLRRLDGREKSQWAFLDETDVSDFAERIPEPAIKFPFELDDFQKRAILQIEQQNSVFVAAHTSAGKTIVAEYAIALAAAFEGKVFYTSPIKTLSNQKLRDFRQKFKDVGLITGDVSINDGAQCVIMTTEILRSMLYRGADVIRDVSFVIFDEVQFLNDEERGVVWEESIIMLPPHVNIIMLSATVPNALEFASWVGKTKERKVAVVATSKRPVPLEHLWLHHQEDKSQELRETLLLQQDGKFLSENYRRALKAEQSMQKSSSKEGKPVEKKSKRKGKGKKFDSLGDEGEKDTFAEGNEKYSEVVWTEVADPKELTKKGVNKNKGQSAKREAASASSQGTHGPNKAQSQWTPLIKFLHEKDRTPTVIFCFSKKKCEKAVESLENHDLLPDKGEKAFVYQFFDNAVVRLREEDRTLPQVLRVRQNLSKGLATHHAGLLPLIKEITEILFSKGLVKVLFATETFAMGVNMPARTVVFAAVRKNDGRRFRFLESGEYTQMSGRAGRRGLDNVGHVYLFFPPDERIPDERQLCRVMTGRPISLQSAFRLTYNMILNVLRVDELRVEEMMKQSFSEAGEDSKTQGITTMLARAANTLSKLEMSGTELEDFGTITSGYEGQDGINLQKALQAYVTKFAKLRKASSKLTSRELNPIFREAVKVGRVVVAEVSPGLLSLCVVYSVVPQRRPRGSGNIRQPTSQLIVRRETQLWVASLLGVISNRVSRHHSSILLLSESQLGRGLEGTQLPPRVVTNDGLVVVLIQVEASKIIYVCDEIDMLSSARDEEQANASRIWHYSHNPAVVKKTLVKNADYIQRVVAKWRQSVNKNGSNEVFLAEVMPADLQGSHTGDDAESDPQPRRPRRHKLVIEVSQMYQARMNTFLELIACTELAVAINRAKGQNIVSKVSALVLEETVRGKMADLKVISDTGSQPSLLPEYLKRVQVLQKMGYVGEDGLSVQLKGRCACEIATVDSVVLTEIILENVLQHLAPGEIASLLSSFVCRKKNVNNIHDKDSEIYSGAYCAAKRTMRFVVEKVGKVQKECGVELDFDIADGGGTYEDAICRWDLAHAVYAWANGDPFFSITDLTEQQEGDIVVCVKRLIELLKDAQALARGIGNEDLLIVLEEAVTLIRRDVIFNGSLYHDEPRRDNGNVEDIDKVLS